MRPAVLAFILASVLLDPARADEAAAPQPIAATVEDLAWMAGHWVGEHRGATIEELWLSPDGGLMVGVNRTVSNGRAVAFEHLSLVDREGTVAYLASPSGRCPPTEFELVESAPGVAVFANPTHDFPQRITYRRSDDTLHARIDGVEDGVQHAAEWTWSLRGSN